MGPDTLRGRLAALLTILIWGTTFLSTKVLLAHFQPTEILFLRFLLGLLALTLAGLLLSEGRLPRLRQGTETAP